MVHICGHWTWPGTEGKTRQVRVYSNCARLELKLNGRSLGVKENAKHEGLAFPARMWDVPYEAGVLEATGYAGSQSIVDKRTTAGAPSGIVLHSDLDRLNSGDRESLAYITASIVDKDGTVVPSAYVPISFTWYGP